MAETDEEALAIARRAYPLWHKHFHHLFRLHGTSPAMGDRPPHFDQIKDGGRGIAGSPATVTRMIRSQMEDFGTDYFVAQFAFGDLTLPEILRTVDLFALEVMPALRSGAAAAQFTPNNRREAPGFRCLHAAIARSLEQTNFRAYIAFYGGSKNSLKISMLCL